MIFILEMIGLYFASIPADALGFVLGVAIGWRMGERNGIYISTVWSLAPVLGLYAFHARTLMAEKNPAAAVVMLPFIWGTVFGCMVLGTSVGAAIGAARERRRARSREGAGPNPICGDPAIRQVPPPLPTARNLTAPPA